MNVFNKDDANPPALWGTDEAPTSKQSNKHNHLWGFSALTAWSAR